MEISRIVVKETKTNVKISDVEKIFGAKKDHYTITAVISATKEIIYHKRQTGALQQSYRFSKFFMIK